MCRLYTAQITCRGMLGSSPFFYKVRPLLWHHSMTEKVIDAIAVSRTIGQNLQSSQWGREGHDESDDRP